MRLVEGGNGYLGSVSAVVPKPYQKPHLLIRPRELVFKSVRLFAAKVVLGRGDALTAGRMAGRAAELFCAVAARISPQPAPGNT